jgi:hypothetical protein
MGNRAMGLNIALGDLDEMERGKGNFGNFHHEDWFAGAKNVRTELRHWGTLWMMSTKGSNPPEKAKPTTKPTVKAKKPVKRPLKRSTK